MAPCGAARVRLDVGERRERADPDRVAVLADAAHVLDREEVHERVRRRHAFLHAIEQVGAGALQEGAGLRAAAAASSAVRGIT